MEPSQRERGTVKTFTIEEANRLLPQITKMLDRMFLLNQRIKSLTADIENLISIWGKDVLEKDHIDNAYYFGRVSEREETFQQLIRKINELQSLGCIIKDPEKGLIDFYYDNYGELVFLCWKYGEDKIKHWHTLDGGFGDRVDLEHLR